MTKKQKLRILAISLVAALAIVPQVAFAAETDVQVSPAPMGEMQETVADSVQAEALPMAGQEGMVADSSDATAACEGDEPGEAPLDVDIAISDGDAVSVNDVPSDVDAPSDDAAPLSDATTLEVVAAPGAEESPDDAVATIAAGTSEADGQLGAENVQSAAHAVQPTSSGKPSERASSSSVPALSTQAPPAFAEGAYVVKVKAAYGTALSVGGSRSAAALKVENVSGQYDQIFYFQQVASGVYAIFSLQSGLALDTSSSDVRQASYTASNHQLFTVKSVGAGFALVSKAGRAFSVSGTSVKTAAFNASASSQRFGFAEAPLVIPGTQVLYAAASPSSALGVAGSSRSAGAVGQIAAYKGEEGQMATVVRNGSGYAVRPLSSGMGLAPSGSSVTQQTKSFVWRPTFAKTGSRRGLVLTDASTAKSLQVSGTSVKMAATASNTAQAFLPALVDIVKGGCYSIKNLAGDIVLEVEAGSWKNGSNVSLYTSNGTGAQMFDIKDMGSGLFQIANAMTGYAVSAASANVYQYSYIGAYDQLWVPVASSGGGVMWINAATGKALNAAGTSAGSNASTTAPSNSKAQSWTLVAGSYASDPVLQTAMWYVNNSSSATDYQIMVDRNNCRTVVAEKSGGVWRPIFNWTCSPGAPSTPTVGGDYTVTGKGYSFSGALGGTPYTCYYYTQFWGDYLFHSVPYHQGTWNVQDDRLGQKLSHGCVRLATENAKWLYDNIPYATHVYIYN